MCALAAGLVCRYISRPAVAVDRLSLTEQGLIRYRLKTPFRDGTTHVLFEPLDFPELIANILSHLQQRSEEGDDEHHYTPSAARAPPQLPLL